MAGKVGKRHKTYPVLSFRCDIQLSARGQQVIGDTFRLCPSQPESLGLGCLRHLGGDPAVVLVLAVDILLCLQVRVYKM